MGLRKGTHACTRSALTASWLAVRLRSRSLARSLVQKNGAGKHTNNTGDQVLEATWQNNLRDGEASLSINNGAPIKIFWREGRMELPTYTVLPPPVPSIKEITRL